MKRDTGLLARGSGGLQTLHARALKKVQCEQCGASRVLYVYSPCRRGRMRRCRASKSARSVAVEGVSSRLATATATGTEHRRPPSCRPSMIVRRKAPRDNEMILPTSNCCPARKSASAAWPLLLLALAATALLLRMLVFPAATGPLEDVHSSTQAAVTSRCVDLNPECSAWAADNQCRRNPQFMHQFCSASCKLCSDGAVVPQGGVTSVVNSQPLATIAVASQLRTTSPRASRAPSGRVETPAVERLVESPAVERPLSAALLQHDGCEDPHTRCEAWRQAGECEKNPAFMKLGCRRSCRLCPNASAPGTAAAA